MVSTWRRNAWHIGLVQCWTCLDWWIYSKCEPLLRCEGLQPMGLQPGCNNRERRRESHVCFSREPPVCTVALEHLSTGSHQCFIPPVQALWLLDTDSHKTLQRTSHRQFLTGSSASLEMFWALSHLTLQAAIVSLPCQSSIYLYKYLCISFLNIYI